jgi:hypothetical protein
MKNKKIKTVFIIAIILIMSYSLCGSLEVKENILNEPNDSAVTTQWYDRIDFSYNEPKGESYPIYCGENDTVGIYNPVWNDQVTMHVLNQTNRDLFWSDQNFSSVITWYESINFDFHDTIIPEGGVYFLVVSYNGTAPTGSINFFITQVHHSLGSPNQLPSLYVHVVHQELDCSNNKLKDETYPIYCGENDSLGIYFDSKVSGDSQNLTIYLLDRMNRDLFWSDQNFSYNMMRSYPKNCDFNNIIIPEDGFYFLVGFYNVTTTSSVKVFFEIIQTHNYIETPIQYTNVTNNYINETYVNETYVNETYVNETYVNETLISNDKINPFWYSVGGGCFVSIIFIGIIVINMKLKRR